MEVGSLITQVVISAVIFIWLWMTLGSHYFGSFFRLLEEREERTEGDKGRAREKIEDTEKVEGAIDHILGDARAGGVHERDRRVEKAKEQASVILSDAREQASKELEAARAEISQLKQKARQDLPTEAAELARVFVDRALQDQKSSYLH